MADGKDKVVAVGGISGFSVFIGLMVLFSFWLANNDPNVINNKTKSVNNTVVSQTQKNNTSQPKAGTYTDFKGQEKTYSPLHWRLT